MTADATDDARPAIWQQATPAMVAVVDVEGMLGDRTSVDPSDYADGVFDALKVMPADDPGRPVLEMLLGILSMRDVPDEVPPFAPMIRWANGSRSAAPGDFAGPLVEVIVALLDRIAHPVLRARLAHLAWFLERRLRTIGLDALRAYLEVARRLDDGRLVARDEEGILSLAGADLLQMAFVVCRGLGRPAKEKRELDAITADLVRRAGDHGEAWPIRTFAELALDVGAVAPKAVAVAIEAHLERRSSGKRDDGAAELWSLAAHAHRRAKDEAASHAATAKASECLVAYAESFVGRPHGAAMAAHWMAQAISTYHGVPSARERRQELRHRLIDIQGGIRDDLRPVSHSTDISELVSGTREQFSGLRLPEALRKLCLVSLPPEPEALAKDARRQMAEFPLSSLFGTVQMDNEGKTVARSLSGALGGEDATEEQLAPKIAQSESIRRGVTVRGMIEVARATIMLEHYLPEQTLFELLRHSPSVPPRLAGTAARGFARWFGGDMVSALCILTPMIEGILRHVLKQHDHDVTTFDDATGTQEDRTITSLYDAMRPELDAVFGQALTDDIHRVFLSKLGPSLRHGVAHALLSDGTPYGDDANYACWLI